MNKVKVLSLKELLENTYPIGDGKINFRGESIISMDYKNLLLADKEFSEYIIDENNFLCVTFENEYYKLPNKAWEYVIEKGTPVYFWNKGFTVAYVGLYECQTKTGKHKVQLDYALKTGAYTNTYDYVFPCTENIEILELRLTEETKK